MKAGADGGLLRLSFTQQMGHENGVTAQKISFSLVKMVPLKWRDSLEAERSKTMINGERRRAEMNGERKRSHLAGLSRSTGSELEAFTPISEAWGLSPLRFLLRRQGRLHPCLQHRFHGSIHAILSTLSAEQIPLDTIGLISE